jgi:hypothetical protein
VGSAEDCGGTGFGKLNVSATVLQRYGGGAGMPAKAVVVSLLSKSSLFGGLEADDLAPLAAEFKERNVAKGRAIFLRGDPGDGLCLVEAGAEYGSQFRRLMAALPARGGR